MCDAEPRFIPENTPTKELFLAIDELKTSVNSLISKYVKSVDAVNRVREIHKPVAYHDQKFCGVCGFEGIPESLAYPCPTIKALGGEQS